VQVVFLTKLHFSNQKHSITLTVLISFRIPVSRFKWSTKSMFTMSWYCLIYCLPD